MSRKTTLADLRDLVLNDYRANGKRSFRRAAVKAGRAIAIPAVAKLREDNARKGFFERPEYEAVRQHMPDYLKPLTDAAYLTCRRISELLSRQWRHVDLSAGWLRLEPGESKKSRRTDVSL